MEKVGDLLRALGFNKHAPLDTQKAFFSHLAKAAAGPVEEAAASSVRAETDKAREPEQLTFDPKILEG